jgi:TPR repeat protein
MGFAMIDAIHASVDRLCARGDFANAVVQLDRAVAIGSMRARVELADIMCSGRVGVPQNIARACALLNDTEARRNPDCMGLRAFLQLRDVCAMDEVVTDHPEYAHHIQYRDAEREAEYSSGEGSKYGHFAYGSFEVVNEITNDDPIAGGFDGFDDMHMDSITAFENSASENYFRAQTVLGCSWYYRGYDDDRSLAMAKRFFTQAAEQGYPLAMHNLGVMCCKESMREHDVPGDEAMHWFNLAAAVPFSPAVDALKVLNEYKHDKAVRIDSIRVVCNEWPGEMMLPDITSRY